MPLASTARRPVSAGRPPDTGAGILRFLDDTDDEQEVAFPSPCTNKVANRYKQWLRNTSALRKLREEVLRSPRDPVLTASKFEPDLIRAAARRLLGTSTG